MMKMIPATEKQDTTRSVMAIIRLSSSDGIIAAFMAGKTLESYQALGPNNDLGLPGQGANGFS